MKYLALFRGIHASSKHKIPMAELRKHFEELGFEQVSTYVQSGNVIFESGDSLEEVTKQIEKALPTMFTKASEPPIMVVITHTQLKSIIDHAPEGFGEEPDAYYSDAIFLKGITTEKAFDAFDPKPDVDAVWKGNDLIYHRRLTAKLGQSNFAKVSNKPIYQHMIVRSWATTTKLLSLMD